MSLICEKINVEDTWSDAHITDVIDYLTQLLVNRKDEFDRVFIRENDYYNDSISIELVSIDRNFHARTTVSYGQLLLLADIKGELKNLVESLINALAGRVESASRI